MLEETPKTDKEQIDELIEINKNILFYSDTVRFNAVVYSGLVNILDRITKLEEKIDNLQKIKVLEEDKKDIEETPKLPELPEEYE